VNKKLDDPFLEKTLARYEKWLSNGQISYSSKVVPVAESFQAKQWVLPTEQVWQVLKNAKSVALQKCLCRTHYNRCDNPVEVCFVLDEVGDKLVAKSLARTVSLAEAADVLRKANESGLVHMSLYMPDHEIYALCSCCACCCHELQLMKSYGRKDLILHSEYIAVTDMDVCTHCGSCVERCVFDARAMSGDHMVYNADACVGCGLCVTICPVEATLMKPRGQ
jgi:NAD-dependent dihydropyrimidine dehydrogenase PreA subunit